LGDHGTGSIASRVVKFYSDEIFDFERGLPKGALGTKELGIFAFDMNLRGFKTFGVKLEVLFGSFCSQKLGD
jgi:hypothetical protein